MAVPCRDCPFRVNTTIGFKNVTATFDSTGTLLSQNTTPLDAVIGGRSGYVCVHKFRRSDILCILKDVRILGAVLCRWARSSSWIASLTLMMKALRTIETSVNYLLRAHEARILEPGRVSCMSTQSIMPGVQHAVLKLAD